MLFYKKKNKQIEEVKELADEVKRYKDLYQQNQIFLEKLLNETMNITNGTKGA